LGPFRRLEPFFARLNLPCRRVAAGECDHRKQKCIVQAYFLSTSSPRGYVSSCLAGEGVRGGSNVEARVAGTSLRSRGHFGGLLGPLRGLLGESGGSLGGLLGASWGPLGSVLGLCGASSEPLGASWRLVEASGGRAWAEGSKCPFRFPLLVRSWGRPGALLGRLGGFLGLLGALLGRL